MVPSQQLLPRLVADHAYEGRRIDDIGEHESSGGSIAVVGRAVRALQCVKSQSNVTHRPELFECGAGCPVLVVFEAAVVDRGKSFSRHNPTALRRWTTAPEASPLWSRSSPRP